MKLETKADQPQILGGSHRFFTAVLAAFGACEMQVEKVIAIVAAFATLIAYTSARGCWMW